jgi:hypothetical protein
MITNVEMAIAIPIRKPFTVRDSAKVSKGDARL